MSIFDAFRKIEGEKTAESPTPPEYILAGLGNPGEKYTFTRHNTGFLAMDMLSQKYGVKVDRARFHALCGEAVIGGKRVLLLKPQTFMNCSGEAVREAAAFYKIPPEKIIVMSDDIAQDVGRIRVRARGSDGGQKGLRSIIEQLRSEEFPRIRIGVGQKPHPDYDLAAWVLSEYSKAEQKILYPTLEDAVKGVEMILSGDFDGAVQFCNSRRPGV